MSEVLLITRIELKAQNTRTFTTGLVMKMNKKGETYDATLNRILTQLKRNPRDPKLLAAAEECEKLLME